MANPNPKPRPRVGESRVVKMTLPPRLWDVIDGDDGKTAEVIRNMLLSYTGLHDASPEREPDEDQLTLPL